MIFRDLKLGRIARTKTILSYESSFVIDELACDRISSVITTGLIGIAVTTIDRLLTGYAGLKITVHEFLILGDFLKIIFVVFFAIFPVIYIVPRRIIGGVPFRIPFFDFIVVEKHLILVRSGLFGEYDSI
ncbi:hypothetical protein RN04_09405 [Arthrobacter sp. W1]|nr:hypothetical protein RN04_09405 [Arthrobacter sp. W1]